MTGKFRFLVVVVFIACLATSAGCESKNAEPAAPARPSPPPSSSDSMKSSASAEQPVTDGECKRFAAAMEAAVRAGDSATYNQMLDWDAAIGKALTGLEELAPFRDVIHSPAAALTGPDGVGPRLIESVAKGGSWKFLRIRNKGKQKIVLFRLLPLTGVGVNYHEILLSRGPGGRITGTDFYVFTTGQSFSDKYRHDLLAYAARAKRGS